MVASERDPLLPGNAIGPLDISSRKRYVILAGLFTASFLSSINATLVPTMIPSISSDFNKSHQASWLGTSFLLATCTFTPLYGRLSNVLGRRGACQLAASLACFGTLLCGFSTSMEMLIVARFISGIGGGGVFTTTTAYALSKSRGLAQGVANVFNGLGMGLGGPIGGLITDWLGWRYAFRLQVPIFLLSIALTTYNLTYVTPGKGKSPAEILKRIDYGGSLTLLVAVGSCLFFLSSRYNESLPWSDPKVIAPLVLTIVFFISFVIVELYFAREPVLAPALLKQRIPVMIGISNFLVATCNFAIMYFFPMWFQVVNLTSASEAGLHLLPNSISMSTGSLFAGWMMHKTGKYKMINLIFGVFPFIGSTALCFLREDSGPIQSWFSIIPLGFGNAVVLQTMLIALLAHIPASHMAVGTGFGQLFRGVGQVGGLAVSSALFQFTLERELKKRIHGPGSQELIERIRHAASLVRDLPPETQRYAIDSYAISIRRVFIFSACSTLLAYLVRLPIPEKDLDSRPRSLSQSGSPPPLANGNRNGTVNGNGVQAQSETTPDEERDPLLSKKQRRRLSGFESTEGTLDLESNSIGGSARD